MTCFAAIGVREFGHIGDDPVDAVFQRRVRVGDGAFALGFGTHVATSPLSESHEKALIRVESVRGLQLTALGRIPPGVVGQQCSSHIGVVIDVLEAVSLKITPVTTLQISTDDDENRVYECADAAQAHYIVTGNRKHFITPYKSIEIVSARELLDLLSDGRQRR